MHLCRSHLLPLAAVGLVLISNAVRASDEIVLAKNRRNATIEYQLWTGDRGFCDESQESLITSGKLGSGETLTLDCRRSDGSRTPGFCIHWRDLRDDHFAPWAGISCQGAGMRPPPVKNIN